MKELSLHILDIAMNSIKAKASILEIDIIENTTSDCFSIKIRDNGTGMDRDMLKSVIDPFTTTRKTRKVGLGIPLLKANAENCNGQFIINSEINNGTILQAHFQLSHIDRPILGNISSVISMLFCSHPDVDVIFTFKKNDEKYSLSSNEIKHELQGISIQDLEVKSLVEEIIKTELLELNITD